MLISGQFSCQRPYHAESTGSRPITEVKQRRASSVLGWVTAWEHGVLLALKFRALSGYGYRNWTPNMPKRPPRPALHVGRPAASRGRATARNPPKTDW